METYESVLLVKSEVFVFKIPPRTTNRAYRAADWNLEEPQWTGRMRLVAKGKECVLKLEDKTSGELFAKCPIPDYPGPAVEAVSDSSRYFVLRIQDDNGRNAFIGVGFQDRSDSFDLNVALQDHFKWVKKSAEIEKEKEEPKQQLDLRFKEGETIKINMKITKKDGSEVSSSKPKAAARPGGAAQGFLPPPPGGLKIAPPPAPSVHSSPQHQANAKGGQESWGEFTSAGGQGETSSSSSTATTQQATTPSNPNWVQF
ncbi:NECAP-like protein CG9132 [Nilaparvata lugens]|uniref:NECAP-like protein CG9132 n=1 Tax=Nilaparvata lugens TaxID=108931 RepID=UPI00193D17DC|nr:NECAP-like protein CG9132 [Nilaparvata lugens]